MKSMSVREGRLDWSSVKKDVGSVIRSVGEEGEKTEEYWLESASQISNGEVMRLLLTLRGPMPPFTIWCLRAKE